MNTPFVRPFAAAEPYEQSEPGDARFGWLARKDVIPGLAIGLVTLRGPIHKTPARHDDWEQVYLIHSGRATIHLAGERLAVSGPTIVNVPKGTDHSVEVDAGNELKYVFVNQYR
jgi:mannose-6-phosphate isomerase-like protein (cupin superfamily)